MLFRKNFGNALATLLGMALALAGGMAHAEIDLDARVAADVGTVTISHETFFNNTGRTLTEAGQTYYLISITTDSTDLRVDGKIDARAPVGRTLYVRLGLENAVFARSTSGDGNPTAGTVRIPDANADGTVETGANVIVLTKEFGGGAGDNFVVYSTSQADAGTTVIETGAIVQWRLHNELAILPNAPVRATQSVHIGLSEARRGEDPLSSKTQTIAVAARSLSTAAIPSTVTATVSSNFTQIAGTGAQPLGVLNVAIGGRTEHLDAQDGSTVTALADVAQEGNATRGTGSLVTFEGDFNVGTFSQGTTLVATEASGTCGSAGLTALGTRNAQRVVQERVVVPAARGFTSFCMSVPTNNTDEIMVGEYTVAVDYRGITNAAFPPSDLGETTIGRVRRDGTRVQIPYLTTFENYTQRVVLVNRNRGAVSYSFSFVEEDGVTTTAGEAATGSVPANSTLVLRAADIVSIAGKSRTAAILDVVAPNGTVDVATTQVNMNDQGTDTVIYETVAN